MREKTIKAVLSKKLYDWIASIEDEQVKSVISKNAIVTGGAIVSLLQNEKPNDFDVYFKTKEAAKAVAQYYVKKWIEAHGATDAGVAGQAVPYVLDGADVEAWKRGEKKLPEVAPNYVEHHSWQEVQEGIWQVSHMITNIQEDRIKIIFPSSGIVEDTAGEKPSIDDVIDACDDLSEMDADMLERPHNDDAGEGGKYRPVFMSTNAITLTNKIQIIIRFYGEPDEIHASYDYVHCTCYWQSWDNRLELPKDALVSIMNKELVYRGSKYPICSVIRSRKFLKRGWHINAGQYLKMAFQISELDLTDVDVLEDQLVGVDTLYFLEVVGALRQMQEKNPAFRFDSTYLNSIIDKIF